MPSSSSNQLSMDPFQRVDCMSMDTSSPAAFPPSPTLSDSPQPPHTNGNNGNRTPTRARSKSGNSKGNRSRSNSGTSIYLSSSLMTGTGAGGIASPTSKIKRSTSGHHSPLPIPPTPVDVDSYTDHHSHAISSLSKSPTALSQPYFDDHSPTSPPSGPPVFLTPSPIIRNHHSDHESAFKSLKRPVPDPRGFASNDHDNGGMYHYHIFYFNVQNGDLSPPSK